MGSYEAVVLAGGAATRLGGRAKPTIVVGGRRMLDWVLAAVSGAANTVVVGPADLDLPLDVRRVQEDPPGGGPAAAIGAAMTGISAETMIVVGGDLPLLRRAVIDDLIAAASEVGRDGAVFVDRDDYPQWLCGVWRTAAIKDRLTALTADRGTLAGASLRAIFEPLRITRVRLDDVTMPPFYDCDTDEDIQRVEEWLAR